MKARQYVLIESGFWSIVVWTVCTAVVALLGNRSPMMAGTFIGMGFGMAITAESNVQGKGYVGIVWLFAIVGALFGLLVEIAVTKEYVTGVLATTILGALLGAVYGLFHGVIRLIMRKNQVLTGPNRHQEASTRQ